jgi:hypothetical protein
VASVCKRILGRTKEVSYTVRPEPNAEKRVQAAKQQSESSEGLRCSLPLDSFAAGANVIALPHKTASYNATAQQQPLKLMISIFSPNYLSIQLSLSRSLSGLNMLRSAVVVKIVCLRINVVSDSRHRTRSLEHWLAKDRDLSNRSRQRSHSRFWSWNSPSLND